MKLKLLSFVLVTTLIVSAALPVQSQGLRATPQLGSLGLGRTADTAQRPADFIVAVVNHEPITNNEVRNRMLRAEQQLAQQGAALPPREEFQKVVLERLISERAQLHLARENGIRIEESAVDQAELNVARQNQLEVAELRKRVVQDGLAVVTFRAELRNQLLLTRLREREVEQRVRVSEQEIDDFVREQQGSTDIAAMEINLAQVLVAAPDDATLTQMSALEARARRIHERASAGEDFAKLAAEFSDASQRTNPGGQMGLRPAMRYPQLFVDAASGLRVGDISPVLRSDAGFHILKVIERRLAGMPNLNVAQTRARHILLRPGAQLSEEQARTQLTDFKRRLEAGLADFAALAKEHSQDGSAREGGDLGWTGPGTFVPEFEEVLAALSPSQIAEPLVSRFGVHLIQLIDRRTTTLTDREQREAVRNLVREKKLEEAYTNWAQEVRGRAYVEMREPPA